MGDQQDALELMCGLHVRFTSDLAASLEGLVYHGMFSFLVTPLVHPRLVRGEDFALKKVPLTRSDLVLESRAWNSCVVGAVSDWIDCDSKCTKVRKDSVRALREELSWATHLSMAGVMLPCPQADCFNYASTLNQLIQSSLQHPTLWVRLPLCTPQSANPSSVVDPDPWTTWNKLRVMCNHSPLLGVMLELTLSLPSKRTIEKWLGEPVRAVLVPTSIFLTNTKGFPVLSAAHQEVFAMLYKMGAQPVLTGRPGHEQGERPYFMYLQHLVRRLPAPSTKDEFEQPFYDYLQSPLQPLGDHLESQMYETFEKCPVKYAKYEEAIELALLDRPEDSVSVVMVVGAGRGPLVRCALQAAATANRRIRMYAVEKNPNAVITLRNMHAMLRWGDTVTVVHTDMRAWDAPEKADIIVSELLGSWGDNELSPECLDGAEKFLKRDGGVSIPYEYTSFVQPISTPRLWKDCKAFDDNKHMETMYVVKLNNFSPFDKVKPVFTFAHPSWHKDTDSVTGKEYFSSQATAETEREEIDNTRYCSVEFTAEQTGLMHGFAGYFECKLYKDVMISINPPTFSDGMFSWFPIYIPVQTPVLVHKGETIKALFWRHVDSVKVWYEWALDKPLSSAVHNVNGVHAPINLKF